MERPSWPFEDSSKTTRTLVVLCGVRTARKGRYYPG